MSKFSFTIPADSISAGVPAANEEVTADRGMTRASKHRVLKASFGDGYEQRVLDGLNTKNDTFSVGFNNRTAAEINLIAKYFDVQAGKNFTFTVTDLDGDTNMKVVCEEYNISYNHENFHSLTTNLRRVYEP